MGQVCEVLVGADSIADHKLVWDEEASVGPEEVELQVVGVFLVEGDGEGRGPGLEGLDFLTEGLHVDARVVDVFEDQDVLVSHVLFFDGELDLEM